jgi:hypothetical protein
MADVADFSQAEEWIVRTTLRERFGHDVDIQYADAEIRLSQSDRELTTCPVIHWQEGGCNFVIFKAGDRRYRCQFFYKPYKQFGTGVREYDDLSECTVALLQAQADQLAEERGDLESKRR